MGAIARFMQDDHERLRALLDAAAGDAVAYAAFREGLLRHIGMEEKVLLPAAAQVNDGAPLAVARVLRADHSAIAAMLVPSPTPELLDRIRALLALHDPLEEGPSGLYADCDRLLEGRVDEVIARLRAAPPVPVAKHFDDSRVHARIAALEAAALAARRA